MTRRASQVSENGHMWVGETTTRTSDTGLSPRLPAAQ